MVMETQEVETESEAKNRPPKLWTVDVALGPYQGVYKVSASRYYDAKSRALEMFLEEFKVPGKPYEYLSTKRLLVSIEVKSETDRRTGTKAVVDSKALVGQLGNLKDLVNWSDIPVAKRNLVKQRLSAIEAELGY